MIPSFPKALGLCLMLAATGATAQNDDAAPDNARPDEAFLRVVMPVGETVRINGHNLVSTPDSPASPWATVGPAESEVIVSDVFVTVQTAPGMHYSYLWGLGGTSELVEDLMPVSADEAVLRLYNLSPIEGLELWIAGQEGAAITGLGSISAAAVVIPPGEISAELRANGEAVGVVEAVVVEGGRGMSIAIWGNPGGFGTMAFADVYVE